MNYFPFDWEADKPELSKRIAAKLENKLQKLREQKEAELLALYRSITSI